MGRYTFLLAPKGARVEGLDVSMGLLERLRAYNTAELEIPLHRVGLEDGGAGTQASLNLSPDSSCSITCMTSEKDSREQHAA